MSDYSQVTDFSAKDALTTGDTEKVILGADVDAELSAISTAIASKYDSSDLATQAQAQAGSLNTVLMTPGRTQDWADANAGIVGDLQALTDPGADRLLGWDDSASAAIAFSLVAGELEFSGTTLGTGSNVPLLDARNEFSATATTTSGSLNLKSTNPALFIIDTDAGSDATITQIQYSGSSFNITARSDSGSSGAALLSASRSGTTWSSLALAATEITLNSVDVSDYARLSQPATFTSGTVQIESSSPRLVFKETDAAADNKGWVFGASSEQLYLGLSADSTITSPSEFLLQVDRSDTNASTINFTNGTLQYGGVEVATVNTAPTWASSTQYGGQITVSTSAASGTPADGDIWIQIES